MLARNKFFVILFLLLLTSTQIVHADSNVSLEWISGTQLTLDTNCIITINIKNTSPNTIQAQTIAIHFSWMPQNIFITENCSRQILPNNIASFNLTTHVPPKTTVEKTSDFAFYVIYTINNEQKSSEIFRQTIDIIIGKSIYAEQPINSYYIIGIIIIFILSCAIIYGNKEKLLIFINNIRKHIPVLIFIVTFIIYTTFLSMNFAPYLLSTKSQQGFPLTGDEPHYLLMTNTFLSGKIDADSIYKDSIAMYRHYRNSTGLLLYGTKISSHPYGLPLLMTVPYFLGETFLNSGAYGVLIFICALTALISVMIYKISMFITKENLVVSILTTVAFAFATNIFMWSGQFFTENIISFFITLAIYKLLTGTKKTDFIVSGIAFAVLPFIKYQGIFIIGGCLLILCLLHIKGTKNLKYVIIPLLFSIVAYILYMYLFIGFGTVDMLGTNTDLGQVTYNILGFNIYKMFYVAFFGLLLDRNYGLFIYSPILILSILGVFQTIKNRNPAIYLSAFIFGFWLSAISGFIGWEGWISIPGKYTIVILPLLCIPFALGLMDFLENIKYKVLYLVLFLIGLIFNILIASNRILGYVMYISNGTDFNWLMSCLFKYFGINITLIPDFNNIWLNPVNTKLLVLWVFGFVIILAILLYFSKKKNNRFIFY
jgi:hypothetical protein